MPVEIENCLSMVLFIHGGMSPELKYERAVALTPGKIEDIISQEE